MTTHELLGALHAARAALELARTAVVGARRPIEESRSILVAGGIGDHGWHPGGHDRAIDELDRAAALIGGAGERISEYVARL